MLSAIIKSDMIDLLEYFMPDVGGLESFSDETLTEVFDQVMDGGTVIDRDFNTRDHQWMHRDLWKRYKVIEEYIIEHTLLVDE